MKKSWKSWIAVVGELIDGPMGLVNGLTITGCSLSDQLHSIIMDYTVFRVFSYPLYFNFDCSHFILFLHAFAKCPSFSLWKHLTILNLRSVEQSTLFTMVARFYWLSFVACSVLYALLIFFPPIWCTSPLCIVEVSFSAVSMQLQFQRP